MSHALQSSFWRCAPLLLASFAPSAGCSTASQSPSTASPANNGGATNAGGSAVAGAAGQHASAAGVGGQSGSSDAGRGGNEPEARGGETSSAGLSGGGASSSAGAANGGQAGAAIAGAPAAGGAVAAAGAPGKPTFDVTFFVVADTHADPPPSDDLLPEARAVNAVAQAGAWPKQIDGQDTHFKGGAIGKPKGVVFVGDLTGWGTAPTELVTFRHYFEQGNSADAIAFPGYVGLGNHDVDSADRAEPLATQYRNQEWAFVDSRHQGASAPVPVTHFDAASHNYSFDFAGVHLIQGNRFVGDTGYGLSSSLGFLAADLKKYAGDGRPVILFQHYGMDAFGTQDRWWTDADRSAYRAALASYHVSAVIVGHTHAAFNYSWEGLRVFQVNNAKAENGVGNNDGNGSFAIVRVTDQQLDVVTCRWLDANGNYELIGPYLSGPTDVGAAQ